MRCHYGRWVVKKRSETGSQWGALLEIQTTNRKDFRALYVRIVKIDLENIQKRKTAIWRMYWMLGIKGDKITG